MNNYNLQISGNTGSGKTQLCKYLLREFTPRAVIFDPLEDYGDEYGEVFTSFDEAASYFLQYRNHPELRIVFRGDAASSDMADDADEGWIASYRQFLKLVVYTAKYELDHGNDWGPLALVFEEAHFYTMPGTEREPWPEIASLFRFSGRRRLLSSISIFQQSTDVDPRVRRGSRIIVALQDPDPPQAYLRNFGSNGARALATLTPYTGQGKPILGRNYLTFPNNQDVVSIWARTLTAKGPNHGKSVRKSDAPSDNNANRGGDTTESDVADCGGSLAANSSEDGSVTGSRTDFGYAD